VTRVVDGRSWTWEGCPAELRAPGNWTRSLHRQCCWRASKFAAGRVWRSLTAVVDGRLLAPELDGPAGAVDRIAHGRPPPPTTPMSMVRVVHHPRRRFRRPACAGRRPVAGDGGPASAPATSTHGRRRASHLGVRSTGHPRRPGSDNSCPRAPHTPGFLASPWSLLGSRRHAIRHQAVRRHPKDPVFPGGPPRNRLQLRYVTSRNPVSQTICVTPAGLHQAEGGPPQPRPHNPLVTPDAAPRAGPGLTEWTNFVMRRGLKCCLAAHVGLEVSTPR